MSEENLNLDCDQKDNSQSSTDLLKKIKTGELNPQLLSPEDRRIVVGILMDEGWSTANIAHTLKVSDRTIERDKRAIFESNALTPDPKLTGQMAGQLRWDAEVAIQHIMSVARSDKTPEVVKVDAYHRGFQIRCQLVEKLQSLGFVTTAVHKIEAGVTHFLDTEQLEQEFIRLKKIQASGVNTETLSQFEQQTPGSEVHNGN